MEVKYNRSIHIYTYYHSTDLKERLSLQGPKPPIFPLLEYQLVVSTRLDNPPLIHIPETTTVSAHKPTNPLADTR